MSHSCGDMAYFADKNSICSWVSDEQLRPYFPEEKAISGLFEVIARILRDYCQRAFRWRNLASGCSFDFI
ncbi:hypothetical protein ACNKHW_22225 [Shigella flexneri]